MKQIVIGPALVAIALLIGLAALASPPEDRSRGGSAGSATISAAGHASASRTGPSETMSMGLRLKLPFPEGERFEVYQGNGGTFSHSGLNRHAWDFGLPEGTPVLASAAGQVVRVKQDSATGGTTPDDYACGNTVIIDHGHGLFTQYLHLKISSVTVLEGDIVRAGQTIALSGNTGFSSTPHLHFQVQNALGQSLPARFVDVRGTGIPRTGQYVTSANDGTGTTPYGGVSSLPRNVFAGNGISLDFADVPAHLLRTDRTYRLAGTITKPAKKVAVFLMTPQGGHPVHTVYCTVDQAGCFSGELNLIGLKKLENWSTAPNQSNPFALAIAPVADDGSFWSSFSVPITAR